MYLIVGLGNPENEYANTRHNMGFDTINEIAKRNNITITKSKFKGLYETAIIQGKKVIPDNFESVVQTLKEYNI